MKWREVPINKTCLQTLSKDPRLEPDSQFLYVDISSIDRTMKVIVQTLEISGSDAPSRARKTIKKGDILVSTVRPNLNAVAIVPQNLDNEIASTGFCVLRPNKKIIDGKYLFYRTTTSDFIEKLTEKIRGAHYPAVSDRDVKAVKIPLPPLPEQHRIVEILDQADRLRKLRTDADTKAQRILPALFIKMFGDPALNPMGWDTVSLDEVVKIGTRLVDPNQPDFCDLPHIGGEHIEKETGRILSPQLVRDSNLRSNKFYFSSKHILLSKIRPYLNKVAYPQFSGVCSADIYPLRPKNKNVTPWYLVSLLRTKAFLDYAKVHSDRLRIPKLNKSQLGSFKFPLPDKRLVVEFDEKAEKIISIEKLRFARQEKIEKLYKVILYKAFSGDLTASWRQANMKELMQELEIQTKALAS